MGNAILAAQHSTRTMAHAIARGIRTRWLRDLQHQIERDAQTAAELAVATGVSTKFVMTEVQGKPRFGNLDASELDAADRVPFADRRPPVAS